MFTRATIYKTLLAAITLAVISLLQQWWMLPGNWNPWKPLEIGHTMNPVTRWKLTRLKHDPEQCLDTLAAAPADLVDYLPLEDYTPVAGCPLTNVVRLRRTSVEFSTPFTVSCPIAVAWLMFEQQRIQPIAWEVLGAQVKLVDHMGSFACRSIAGSPTGRRSEHASASALDIAGFHLEDGRRVSVLDDWDSQRVPEKARFLRRIHAGACDFFGTVLGPEYNQAHHNHFHFDNSGFRFCR